MCNVEIRKQRQGERTEAVWRIWWEPYPIQLLSRGRSCARRCGGDGTGRSQSAEAACHTFEEARLPPLRHGVPKSHGHEDEGDSFSVHVGHHDGFILACVYVIANAGDRHTGNLLEENLPPAVLQGDAPRGETGESVLERSGKEDACRESSGADGVVDAVAWKCGQEEYENRSIY